MTGPTPRPTSTVPRTALVTGAGRGIGRHLALGLADAGYDVGLVGRTRSRLEEVAAEVQERTGGARTVVTAAADLVDVTAVADAVARVEVGLPGGIGLLVNNAGVIERQDLPFAQDDVEDIWRVVETNVRGPLLVTHAVLPGMLARGGGRVLNLNSGSGYRALPSYTGYAISKGALARLTTLLVRQHGDQGIRALDLAPGVVETDMSRSMRRYEGRSEWTDPADVVALAVAFADGELDALTGRFVRAGADTVAWLREHAAQIVAADARTLRVTPLTPDDPLA